MRGTVDVIAFVVQGDMHDDAQVAGVKSEPGDGPLGGGARVYGVPLADVVDSLAYVKSGGGDLGLRRRHVLRVRHNLDIFKGLREYPGSKTGPTG